MTTQSQIEETMNALGYSRSLDGISPDRATYYMTPVVFRNDRPMISIFVKYKGSGEIAQFSVADGAPKNEWEPHLVADVSAEHVYRSEDAQPTP